MNLLTECDRRGIRLEANGDMLKVDAPKGALSPDLVEALKAHKPEILAALRSQSYTEAEDLREHFEERAGILEYDAPLPRPEAEIEAARMTATAARNRGYSWVAPRSALAGYPALCYQIPKDL